MIEVYGELWDFADEPGFVVCITTNGTIKKNGECVMGRGCAAEAKARFSWLPKVIGTHIVKNGNIPLYIPDLRILTFPVKHNWYEQADLDLIKDSAQRLYEIASHSAFEYILPRPGCGNGRLTWSEVKPILQDLPDNVRVISRG